MRMNHRMLEYFRNSITAPDANLIPNDSIAELLNSSLVQQGDCIFLSLLLKKSHVRQNDFPDHTGYEAFVNHIHVSDLLESRESSDIPFFLLKQGIMLAHALRKKLICTYPDTAFQIAVSYDEIECTVRFYRMRDNESWLTSDLEQYTEEAIMAIEVQP
jgi:hypothetical protein